MTSYPPPLPSTKPPFRFKRIFIAIAGLCVFGAVASNSDSGKSNSTSSTAPVARSETSEFTRDEYGFLVNRKTGNLSDSHDIKLRVAASVAMYARYCGKVNPTLEENVDMLIDGAGIEQMLKHFWVVQETRQKVGANEFCMVVREQMRSANIPN